MLKINLTKADTRQTLKGFGTSACWWSQNISDEKTAAQIAALLYSEKGLNLNIYRYNVGAGFTKDNCRVENSWRRTESFYLYDDANESEGYHGGDYDFTRDKNAYNFMKLCLKTGSIDTVVLFANSPHYSFTSSGQASGSMIHHTCNLPASNYMRFVNYLLDIAEHFLEDNIPVNYISPINEPQWCWGGKNVWQEGCHYEPGEVAQIFHLFAAEIERRRLDIKLYGPESGEIAGLTEKYLMLFEQDELIMRNLGAFAFHSYHADRNNDVRSEFYKNIVLKHPHIRFDMSEWCELPCKSKTHSINGALIMARIIGLDLTALGAESWCSWVAANQFAPKNGKDDYADGLISANDDFSEYYVTKRYYAMLHFTRFLPVGSIVSDTHYEAENGLYIFTFKLPGDTGEVVVAVNEGLAKDIEITSTAKGEEIYSTTARSTFRNDYKGKYRPVHHIKARSITTVKLWK
ncbi:MAG: hypothetical protein LUH82_07030 [Clostridiales bacterium]|nr:hypothetical protein [Clostridiales bacterium]